MFSKLRRLLRASRSFHSPPTASLVLLEHGNPEFLRVLDLRGSGFTTLTTGYDHLYLGARVLLRCVHHLFRVRKLTAQELGLAYLKACLDCTGARVVLTVIDNSILFYHLAATCPGVNFVAVQNGMRDQDDPDFNGQTVAARATYFCFGDYDVSLREASSVNIATVTPIGSVLSSHFKATRAGRDAGPVYDVCLVSQFRPSILDDDTNPQTAAQKQLALYLMRAAKDGGLTVCVAGATLDDPREKAFFDTLFGNGIRFSFRDALSSYDLMDRSRIVVGVHSTCLYEAFSWGKKTLFCPLYDAWHPQKLPRDEVWLLKGTQVEYERFKERLEAVLAMPDQEFEERSRSEARYFVHYRGVPPAHEVVKAHLESLL